MSKQEAAQTVSGEHGGCIINVENHDYNGEPAREVKALDTNSNTDAGGPIVISGDGPDSGYQVKVDLHSDPVSLDMINADGSYSR